MACLLLKSFKLSDVAHDCHIDGGSKVRSEKKLLGHFGNQRSQIYKLKTVPLHFPRAAQLPVSSHTEYTVPKYPWLQIKGARDPHVVL